MYKIAVASIGMRATVKSQTCSGLGAPAFIITSFHAILLAPCPIKVIWVAMLAHAIAGYSSLLRLVPMSLAMPTSSGIIMAAVAVALVMAPKNAAAAQDRKIRIRWLSL